MGFWSRTRIPVPGIVLLVLAGVLALNILLNTKDELPFKNFGLLSSILSPENNQRVHLLIPGNKANSRICRTITSSIINNFPPPTIINWGQNEGNASMNGYDMITGKNWGVLKYLRSLPPKADNDLVIMVDAHDVVFQLPLSVALQRYVAIRDSASARTISQHGPEEVFRHGLQQTIIMGAEKYCWPLDHRHPACFAVPTSPLREDAYGNKTDKLLFTNRPRWLNSGTIMGPVGDLRKLYEWAHLLWMAYDTPGGDQDYFSNIYGRQELSRQRLRGGKDWVFGFGEHFEEKDLIWPHMETKHTDYHLGVDLTSTLFQALNAALDDLSSVVHSNNTDMLEKDHSHGTASIYNAPFPFPEDLLKLPVPKGRQANYGVDATTWRDVRLFSNFHARSIPVILHYNGDKSRVDSWWQRQWWTGMGRELMQMKMGHAGFPIMTDANVTLQWADMCEEFSDQIFVEPIESNQ
ncbi:hypothetical protein QQS21_002496 [Conoideocrella luteorostrata]|uniref:Uncharacterized protein n=1 Tax=Conoideocrella luteorostrata TaxID=1105319 RepID=A0AAJ0CXU6_9HYPO|nr:hypothetical protein QQS21_002496 [Conoideocrella luteorostrata]